MTPTIAPRYLHASRRIGQPLDEVVARLERDIVSVAARATTAALADLGAVLERGRFRRSPAPRVSTRAAADPSVLAVIGWNAADVPSWPPPGPFATRPTARWWLADEEATGWPSLELELVATPAADGTLLTLLSTRAPGYDVSTPRADKQVRAELLRTAPAGFLAALVDELERARAGQLSGPGTRSSVR